MKNTSRNLNYFTLLTSHAPFQKRVKALRKDLEIGTSGLADADAFLAWRNAKGEIPSEFFSSEYNEKIQANIMENLTSGMIDKDMATKQLELLGSKLRANRLETAAHFLMEQYDLPVHFYTAVKNYLAFNRIAFVPDRNFSYVLNNESEAKRLTITIHSKLTTEEIAEMNDLIKDATHDFQKIKKIADKTVGKIPIEDWNKYQDNQQSSAEVMAEEYLGDPKKRQQVYDTKRTLDAQRKKLFGK
jgi:hypothetical protein